MTMDIDTDGMPQPIRLSPSRKAAMLANLEVELQSRKERYERDTVEMEESILRQCRALATLPREIANMDMRTFCVVYGGDINAARRGLAAAEESDAGSITSRTRAQRGRKQQKDPEPTPQIPETPMKFNTILPETPANPTVNSRRITLRSHAKLANQQLIPPTPSIQIPLGNGGFLDFDTNLPAHEIKDGLGEDDRKAAVERLLTVRADLDRILAELA